MSSRTLSLIKQRTGLYKRKPGSTRCCNSVHCFIRRRLVFLECVATRVVVVIAAWVVMSKVATAMYAFLEAFHIAGCVALTKGAWMLESVGRRLEPVVMCRACCEARFVACLKAEREAAVVVGPVR